MKIYNDSNSILLRKGFLEVRCVKNSKQLEDALQYEVINKNDAVVCLVLTNDLKNVYLTKQFRPSIDDYEWGLVAGIVDKQNLAPMEICIEEIEEEIRISRNDIESIEYLGVGFSSSGMTTERLHRYVCVLKKYAIQDDTLQKAHDTDLIERFIMPFNYETYKLLTSNTSQLLFNEVYPKITGKNITPQLKIGVYGGCFSPMTVQHIFVIIRTIEAFNLDKVIITPTSDKDSKQKVPYELRKKIIEATISDLPTEIRNKIIISDIEQEHFFDTSYKNMSLIRKQYGFLNKYYAIFGMDNIISMEEDNWVELDELMENFETIAIERDGFDLNEIFRSYRCMKLIKYKEKIHSIPPINENKMSSTMVRNNLFNGLSIAMMVSVNAEIVIKENLDTFKKCYGKI